MVEGRADGGLVGAHLAVPATHAYLGLARTAVRMALVDEHCDVPCCEDLAVATDLLATMALGLSRPGSTLTVGMVADDEDAYLRVRLAAVASRHIPVPSDAVWAALHAVVDSLDVRIEGRQLVAVAQRRLDR